MRSYKIYLYRHGITEGNLQGKYIGVTDTPLCPQGEEELRRLAQEKEYPAVGILYTSPLRRCLETGRILYPEMEPVAVPQLKEYNFGIFEDKTMDQLKTMPQFGEWARSNMRQAPEGGEDMGEFTSRIREGFDWLIKDMMRRKISSAAVITHGGVIMSALGMFGLPKMEPANWSVQPGCGYSLLINAAMWGNTMTFEICDRIPYERDEEYELENYQLMDVEKLRQQYREEWPEGKEV